MWVLHKVAGRAHSDSEVNYMFILYMAPNIHSSDHLWSPKLGGSIPKVIPTCELRRNCLVMKIYSVVVHHFQPGSRQTVGHTVMTSILPLTLSHRVRHEHVTSGLF